MVPVIRQDEEVEECSFVPRPCRGPTDNALRKWGKGDLGVKDTGANIGGGTFGEGQQNKYAAICFRGGVSCLMCNIFVFSFCRKVSRSCA